MDTKEIVKEGSLEKLGKLGRDMAAGIGILYILQMTNVIPMPTAVDPWTVPVQAKDRR